MSTKLVEGHLKFALCAAAVGKAEARGQSLTPCFLPRACPTAACLSVLAPCCLPLIQFSPCSLPPPSCPHVPEPVCDCVVSPMLPRHHTGQAPLFPTIIPWCLLCFTNCEPCPGSSLSLLKSKRRLFFPSCSLEEPHL